MKAKRFLAAALIAVFGLQVTSCGYILHPERKGQTGGRIDPAVAVLDGVGLLLFLIPGIVAFVVDFHYGTIYLPGTQSADAGSEDGEPRTVKVEGELTRERVEAILARETGAAVDLDEAEIRMARSGSPEEIRTLLGEAEPSGG
ncbi:MAG: hypothetical protein ACLFV8_09475 [Alphaproteobacteria bacterium]